MDSCSQYESIQIILKVKNRSFRSLITYILIPKFMERAGKTGEEEGPPKLSVKMPWYGTPIELPTEENKEEAELAFKGKHYKTETEKIARRRIKV